MFIGVIIFALVITNIADCTPIGGGEQSCIFADVDFGPWLYRNTIGLGYVFGLFILPWLVIGGIIICIFNIIEGRKK
jgi:hypothetical protein